jgi:hypothetical protein
MFTRCVLIAILVWAWLVPHAKALPSVYRTSAPRHSYPRGQTKAICSLSLRYRKELATKIEAPRGLRDSLQVVAPVFSDPDFNAHFYAAAPDSEMLYRLKSLRR